jgi:hypothetical protein
MSSKNAHLLGNKLFAATILHEQKTYKEQYNAHLENFIDAGETALSEMFNALSEADIVRHYYTNTPCTKDITAIFPLHEGHQTPWIGKQLACDELQAQSAVLDKFKAALNTAHMDIELEIVEKKAARKDAQPQHHFSFKFNDYHAHSL